MFHEVDQDRIDRTRGMDITVTTATNDDEGRALLKQLVSFAELEKEQDMAKTALRVKAARKPKFAVRTPAASAAAGPRPSTASSACAGSAWWRWPTAASSPASPSPAW